MQTSQTALPPAGTPTPAPSPAAHTAAALHPAAWGVHRTRYGPAHQPASPLLPPAPPSTPQVVIHSALGFSLMGLVLKLIA